MLWREQARSKYSFADSDVYKWLEAAAWEAWKQISGKYSTQLTGLTAMVESADLGTKGTFYRVQTGPFATVAAAQERCTAMKAAGLDCLVVGKP